MKAIRFTCWLMIAALLLHGSGVLSSIHKLRHHGGDVSLVVGCHHELVSSTHEHADDEPAPERDPDRDDGDCEICLGLAGLHLIPVEDAPRVVAAPAIVTERSGAPGVPFVRDEPGDHPARAPPVS